MSKHDDICGALVGIATKLHEYLTDDNTRDVPEEVAMAYCEAVDALLEVGVENIKVGEKRYSMEKLEEVSVCLKEVFGQ